MKKHLPFHFQDEKKLKIIFRIPKSVHHMCTLFSTMHEITLEDDTNACFGQGLGGGGGQKHDSQTKIFQFWRH